ncbi:MAG: toprim domain-containing protein [Vicinamibacterales bacterium]
MTGFTRVLVDGGLAVPKLMDCRRHGPGSGAELFVVEGDSAAGTVALVRDAETQAVLPMQGKPMNAVKASPEKVVANPWFQALTQAMGAGDGPAFDLARVRYERVVLLMDADADGIHCAALMCLYFYRRMWPLLAERRVSVAHPPLACLSSDQLPRPLYVFTEPEYRQATQDLRAVGHDLQVVRYRGLAGVDLEALATASVRPATRTLQALGRADADAMMRVLGRGEPQPTLF